MKADNCFYVIGSGSSHYRKVGISSSSLMVRLQNIQTGNPLRLEFILLLQFEADSDAIAMEFAALGALINKSTMPCVGEWSHVRCTDDEFFDLILDSASKAGLTFKQLLRNPRAIYNPELGF